MVLEIVPDLQRRELRFAHRCIAANIIKVSTETGARMQPDRWKKNPRSRDDRFNSWKPRRSLNRWPPDVFVERPSIVKDTAGRKTCRFGNAWLVRRNRPSSPLNLSTLWRVLHTHTIGIELLMQNLHVQKAWNNK